jgi:hypothetical protein
MILRLEDILGTNDDTFQTIWYGTGHVFTYYSVHAFHSPHLSDRYAANISLSYVSNGKRMSKRSVLQVNVDRSWWSTVLESAEATLEYTKL